MSKILVRSVFVKLHKGSIAFSKGQKFPLPFGESETDGSDRELLLF
ncbi:MAG: hypothetical protein SXA11_18455 [Cyanobacteriota bacterium]|nr:hypothetical protein [Cyanobacteriota bacterium]